MTLAEILVEFLCDDSKVSVALDKIEQKAKETGKAIGKIERIKLTIDSSAATKGFASIIAQLQQIISKLGPQAAGSATPAAGGAGAGLKAGAIFGAGAAIGFEAMKSAIDSLTKVVGILDKSIKAFLDNNDEMVKMRNNIASLGGETQNFNRDISDISRQAMNMGASFQDAQELARRALLASNGNSEAARRFANNAMAMGRALGLSTQQAIAFERAAFTESPEAAARFLRHNRELMSVFTRLTSDEQRRIFLQQQAIRGQAILSEEGGTWERITTKIGNQFERLWQIIGKIFGPSFLATLSKTANFFEAFVDKIEELSNTIDNSQILEFLKMLWESFAQGRTEVEIFEDAWLQLENIWSRGLVELRLLWLAFEPIIEELMDSFSKAGNWIAGVLKNLGINWTTVWEYAKMIFFTMLLGPIGVGILWLIRNWDRVLLQIRLFPNTLDMVAAKAVGFFDMFKANIPIMIDNFFQMGSWIVNNLPKFFKIAFEACTEILKAFGQQMKNAITDPTNFNPSEVLRGFGLDVQNAMRNARNAMTTAGVPTMRSFLSMEEASPAMAAVLRNLEAQRWEITKEYWKKMKDARTQDARDAAQREYDLRIRQHDRRVRDSRNDNIPPGGLGGQFARPGDEAKWGDIMSVWKNIQQKAFGLTYEDQIRQNWERQISQNAQALAQSAEQGRDVRIIRERINPPANNQTLEPAGGGGGW